MLANFTAVHLVSSNLQSKIFNLKWMGRVFPRCAKLLPWVLRICGRAEGGGWSDGVLALESWRLNFDFGLLRLCFGGVGSKVCGARGFFGFVRGVLVRVCNLSFEVVCTKWVRRQIVLHARRGYH